MADMSELTDDQKSAMLTRAAGFEFLSLTGFTNAHLGWRVKVGDAWIDGVWGKDIYRPANMALAWWVLNWAHMPVHGYFEDSPLVVTRLCDEELPAAAAMRNALDEVLRAAIEKNVVKVK